MRFVTLPASLIGFLIFFVNLSHGQNVLPGSLPVAASNYGNLDAFVTLVNASGLRGLLSTPTLLFTVFAPQDSAFSSLPEGLFECLLLPDNKDTLTEIIYHHTIRDFVASTMFLNGMTLQSMQGERLMLDLTQNVRVNGVSVRTPDLFCSNGILHIIQGVLFPPTLDIDLFMSTSCPTTEVIVPPTAVPTVGSLPLPTSVPIVPTLAPAVDASTVTPTLSSKEVPTIAPVPSPIATIPTTTITESPIASNNLLTEAPTSIPDLVSDLPSLVPTATSSNGPPVVLVEESNSESPTLRSPSQNPTIEETTTTTTNNGVNALTGNTVERNQESAAVSRMSSSTVYLYATTVLMTFVFFMSK